MSTSFAKFLALERLFERTGQPVFTLNLSFKSLGTPEIAHLVQSPLCPQLEQLDLSGVKLGDAGLTLLASGGFLCLSELDVTNNEIGDDGVAALASSTSMPRLTRLNLRRNRVGPRGVAALCRSSLATRLTSLNLDANDELMTAVAVEQLVTVFGYERLWF